MEVIIAVPYSITTNYTVNYPVVTYSGRPRICMNILSRSNKLPYGKFETVTNLADFIKYFPDDNPHSTVERAKTFLDAGYFLYLQNVYKAESSIGSRIYNIKDNIITTPIPNTVADSSFILNNMENSVIKVDISKAGPKDWLLLECKSETGTQNNTLIWFHDQDQDTIDNYVDDVGNKGEYYFIQDYLGISLQFIYFAEGYGININKDDIPQKFKELLEKSTLGFELFYGDSGDECFIANNLGFINIGNHTSNIEVEMKKEFIPYVMALTQRDYAVLDIRSKYHTDNNEIVVQVSEIKDYMYKVIVAQIKDNRSIISETHVGSTSQAMIYNEKAPSLIDSLSQSTLINIVSYSEEFRLPKGYIYLSKFGNENDEIYKKKIKKDEIFMFLQGVNNMETSDYHAFHFYYDSNLNSLKYQQALYDIYKDTSAYGIFTFRGVPITDAPNNLAYFSEQKIHIGNNIYYTSDLLIYLLSTIHRYIGSIDNASYVSPYYYDKENVNYINNNSIATGLQLRGFLHGKLKDLRYCLIEPILLKEIYDQGDVSYSSIQQGITNTKDIFREIFDVIVNIELVEYKAIAEFEIGARIQYSADFENINDVDEIAISLQVN